MVPFLGAGTEAVSPNKESTGIEKWDNKDLMGIEDGEKGKSNKGLPHGIKPSQKEVEEHERTHLPFRSWCEHCVKGKAKSHPHYKQDEEDVGIPTISWDYFYMKDEDSDSDEADDEGEGDSNSTPMIAWHDSNSKGIMAFAVPKKGEDEYAIRRATQDVCKIFGYYKMVFKGDQEPALRTFMDQSKRCAGINARWKTHQLESHKATGILRMQYRE